MALQRLERLLRFSCTLFLGVRVLHHKNCHLRHFISRVFFIVFLLFTNSCQLNVFSPVDEPSGKDQLISAARACFDRGDLDCAKNYYDQLSSDSDVRNSEEAFVLLDRYGAGMGNFILSFGSGDGGTGITLFANKLASEGGTPGVTKRLALYEAYLKTFLVQNTALRGLVRFVTALAIACELLAEGSGSDLTLQKSDLAGGTTATANSCYASTTACGVGDANCNKPSSSALQNTANVTNLRTTNATAMSGNPELGMLQSALTEVSYALQTEMVVTGKFSTGTLSAIQAINAQNVTLNSGQCYRNLLILNGVGG